MSTIRLVGIATLPNFRFCIRGVSQPRTQPLGDQLADLSDAVAAGEGALPTLITRSVSWIRKSSTIPPSG